MTSTSKDEETAKKFVGQFIYPGDNSFHQRKLDLNKDGTGSYIIHKGRNMTLYAKYIGIWSINKDRLIFKANKNEKENNEECDDKFQFLLSKLSRVL